MAFVSLYLGLGSNIGDRQKNILAAVEMLDARLGCHYTAFSSIIETQAFGFKGGKFLNAAVMYRIYRDATAPEVQATAVLDICKDIERALGRTDVPEYDDAGNRIYRSRTIDIDILFFGNERIETPRLVVPHLGIRERVFVMMPLREIAKPTLKAAFPEIFD